MSEKSFFDSLYFLWWSKFVEEILISSVKKLPISNDESFLESIFNLNQIFKILITQNSQIWEFNASDLLYIFFREWRNSLLIYKMSKNWNLKENGPSWRQNFVWSENPRQNIWNKIEKSGKLDRKRKAWYLHLRVLWLLLPKFNFWKWDLALGYISSQIWDI